MAQILIRELTDAVVTRLKRRARGGGRSLQAEVKSILEGAANDRKADRTAALKAIQRLRRRFAGRKFPDSATLIREDRER